MLYSYLLPKGRKAGVGVQILNSERQVHHQKLRERAEVSMSS